MTEIQQRDVDELAAFNRQVNLVRLAEHFGYTVDHRESTAKGVILRRDDGNKLSVIQGNKGCWLWYDFRTKQSGTVIDFVQRETGDSLVQTRHRLRAFLGTGNPKDVDPVKAPRIAAQSVVSDTAEQDLSSQTSPSVLSLVGDSDEEQQARERLQETWERGKSGVLPVYLLTRGLTAATLADERFIDTFRESDRGTVLFIHRDRSGLSGYEFRNASYKGFARGGSKAFWYSNNLATADVIVICESAIDCLSHYEMFRWDVAYLSFAGTISRRQRDLFTGLFQKAQQRGQDVFVATDNDPTGNGYYELLSGLAGFSLERLTPVGNDWNDDLTLTCREAT